MKTKITLLLTLLLSAIHLPSRALEINEVPNVHLADSTQFVSNPRGILSQPCVDSLNVILHRTMMQTSAEVVVVALHDIPSGTQPIDFAVNLGQTWGVGKKDRDNGVVILLVTDLRKMSIAPGYGAEGVLPDAVCSRIIRNIAIPYFRNNDYDAGLLAATKAVCNILTNPSNTAEILSTQRNNSRANSSDDFSLFNFMLVCGAIAAVAMLVIIVFTYTSTRRQEDVVRYNRLASLKPVALFLSFIGLGLPLPAYLLCAWLMNRLRNHPRKCPNCSHPMKKLDEQTDNLYLTPAQDREEQLNSVDYDVWLCPQCGEKDVIPYINRQSGLTECEHCGARACQLVTNRTLVSPSTTREGIGEKVYSCKNCGQLTRKPYKIAKLAAPIVIIGPGGGGRGGFGGGGFGGGGGSFGGGSFGGGGATGGW
ncbi:MAG: TPM domain-containing protein [Firmicutes bacterium]|nr:TPM domain-containing protein [Bacillota bacterium]MCM1401952.1 TPM domain-containing protein [Bacteroides sp.]MCM1477975.1 TPM domain-containing protein [Bacteroides sp.]